MGNVRAVAARAVKRRDLEVEILGAAGAIQLKWERDRLGHCHQRLADGLWRALLESNGGLYRALGLFGGTPNSAGETPAIPKTSALHFACVGRE